MSSALLEPKLWTGLNRWELWLLIGLSRHVARQKWVSYIVESRLRGDLHRIGNIGAFGHPEEIKQRGKVPDFPEWTYFFHGCGCCLINEAEGMEIDVDFSKDGQSLQIDPYFYSNFLDSLKNPELPESILKKPAALNDYWQVDLEALERMGCWADRQVTDFGTQVYDALAPIIDHLSKLQGQLNRAQKTQSVYLALQLGDCVYASSISDPDILPLELVHEIKNREHIAKALRAEFLTPIVSRETQRYGIPLQALAELGPEFSQTETMECLFHTPVDGAANQALEILDLWQPNNFDSVLADLIEFRAGENNPSLVSRIFRWKMKQGEWGDAMPRASQFVHAARLLFIRQHGKIETKIKSLLITVLKEINTARRGEAAFLLYFLDKAEGLKALDRCLFDRIPMANYEAAAACVLIGSDDAKSLLIKALGSSGLEKQHAAACALSKFPSGDPIPELVNWMQVQDGITDPIGNDTQFDGRTVQTYSMSDVAHANMQNTIDWAIKSFEDIAVLLGNQEKT